MTPLKPHDFDGFETLGRIVIVLGFIAAALALIWLFGGV